MTGPRIERSVQRAEAAFKAMIAAKDVDDQQASWEVFVADWRTALNQIATASKRAGREEIASAMHLEREGDPVLDYVWEARNAEEHTADGTSETSVQKVTEPLTLNGEPFTFKGDPIVLTGAVTLLSFKPLKRRNQTLIPPQEDPIKVATLALSFLQRYYSKFSDLGL